MSVSVVCFKWGSAYTADHVNRLGAMLARNLSIDYELVCVTDDPQGIKSTYRTIPLWDDLADLGRRYRRLKLFSEEVQSQLRDKIVQIDLDVVILSDITSLLDRDEDFVIWDGGRPPQPAAKVERNPISASIWMCRNGTRREIWEEFDAKKALDLALVQGLPGSDTAWINYMVADPPLWTADDGIYSFSRFVKEKGLPADAHVVFFGGLNDPSDPVLQKEHPWIGQHWKIDFDTTGPFIFPRDKRRRRRRKRGRFI